MVYVGYVLNSTVLKGFAMEPGYNNCGFSGWVMPGYTALYLHRAPAPLCETKHSIT